MSKIMYEVVSEGKVLIDQEGNEFPCGEVFINEIEVEVDEDGDIVESNIIEGFVKSWVIEDKYIDDQPRIIEGVWDDGEYELEFTNGLINWDEFNNIEDAIKFVESYLNQGIVDVKDLDFE